MAAVKALVTGSSGFLGRHFAAELRDRGWRAHHCDPIPARSPAGLNVSHDARRMFADDRADRYDLVVHCAAVAPHRAAIDGQPATLIRNQLLDAAMFDWAARTQQRHVLYISSCAALDEEPDAYGLLKLTGERMADQARAAGIPVTVVRPYSGYGEDQGEDWPFGAFAARARRREDPFTIWGDGTQVRDWIHVSDVVNGALAVVEQDVREPVNLCTGAGTSMAELVGLFCKTAGYDPQIQLHTGKPAGVAYRVGDPQRFHRIYQPKVDIAEGVRRALAC